MIAVVHNWELPAKAEVWAQLARMVGRTLPKRRWLCAVRDRRDQLICYAQGHTSQEATADARAIAKSLSAKEVRDAE